MIVEKESVTRLNDFSEDSLLERKSDKLFSTMYCSLNIDKREKRRILIRYWFWRVWVTEIVQSSYRLSKDCFGDKIVECWEKHLKLSRKPTNSTEHEAGMEPCNWLSSLAISLTDTRLFYERKAMMSLFPPRLLLLKPGLMLSSLRTLPSENFQNVADQFTKYDIQGLLIVGGFEVRPIIRTLIFES